MAKVVLKLAMIFNRIIIRPVMATVLPPRSQYAFADAEFNSKLSCGQIEPVVCRSPEKISAAVLPGSGCLNFKRYGWSLWQKLCQDFYAKWINWGQAGGCPGLK
jgi:hypothetical protein